MTRLSNQYPGSFFNALKPVIASNFSSHRYGSINDCCVMLVHCAQHNRFALCNSLHSGQHFRWFPFMYMSPSMSWDQARLAILSEVLAERANPRMVSRVSCLNVFRVQLPRTLRFITRMMCYVRLDARLVDPCQRPTKIAPIYMQWHPIEDAIDGSINNLWGPEVVHFLSFLLRGEPVQKLVQEISVQEAFNVLPAGSKPKTIDEEMIIANKVTAKEVERVYDEFIEHCFPSYFLSWVAFQCFFTRHAIESDLTRLDSYWKAFRYLEKPYLSFNELFVGLVAIDRETPHCETRLKFIFKFYDSDQDGTLDLGEFSRMFKDINPNLSEKEFVSKLTIVLNDIKYKVLQPADSAIPLGPPRTIHRVSIGFGTFYRSVKNQILVGTSRLCRSRVAVFSSISHALVTRRIEQTFEKKHSFRQVITNTSQPTDAPKCTVCVAQNQKTPYRIASTVLTLNEKRQLKRVSKLRTASHGKSDSEISHSVEVQFNHKALANVYLKVIGDFGRSAVKGKGTEFKGLFAVIPSSQQAQFEADIEIICSTVSDMVQRQPHIVDLNSPIFVIGDIHGNIEDLLTLEASLWPTKPFISGNNYLFLGDYVDRGHWGFECVIYLFCLMILAPDKFTLLRGNHEIRSTQENFSYKAELAIKYGTRIGTRFFELTNQVFDRLPCGAVVERKIFCAHGGIPCTSLAEPIRESTSKLGKVNPTPECMQPIWEILWSDPVERKTLRDDYELLTDIEYKRQFNQLVNVSDLVQSQLYQQGFLFNHKRGTAYLFTDIAFGSFCAVNGFTHMVRAHEVPMEGYRLNFSGHCITTFSCSHYCGFDNLCAVVYLQDSRIRIVQLHTADNSSATDFD